MSTIVISRATCGLICMHLSLLGQEFKRKSLSQVILLLSFNVTEGTGTHRHIRRVKVFVNNQFECGGGGG